MADKYQAQRTNKTIKKFGYCNLQFQELQGDASEEFHQMSREIPLNNYRSKGKFRRDGILVLCLVDRRIQSVMQINMYTSI